MHRGHRHRRPPRYRSVPDLDTASIAWGKIPPRAIGDPHRENGTRRFHAPTAVRVDGGRWRDVVSRFGVLLVDGGVVFGEDVCGG